MFTLLKRALLLAYLMCWLKTLSHCFALWLLFFVMHFNVVDVIFSDFFKLHFGFTQQYWSNTVTEMVRNHIMECFSFKGHHNLATTTCFASWHFHFLLGRLKCEDTERKCRGWGWGGGGGPLERCSFMVTWCSFNFSKYVLNC